MMSANDWMIMKVMVITGYCFCESPDLKPAEQQQEAHLHTFFFKSESMSSQKPKLEGSFCFCYTTSWVIL